MAGNDIAELHQNLDDAQKQAFEMAQHSVRFAQNWYLVANAGGVTASIGYLGTYGDRGPGLYAALATLTIFLVGFGLSMHSATLYARLLSEYATETWHWVQSVKNADKRRPPEPEFDQKLYDRIGMFGKIGRGCAYGGGAIGLVSLWFGQICRVMS